MGDEAKAPALSRLKGGGVAFEVLVTPGSARARIVGLHGDALKVAVCAPPEKGQANKALAALLAESLGLPRKQLSVISGLTSRKKRIAVEGMDVERLRAALARLC